MCPKSKEQFASIRAKSEKKLLNAALKLFAEEGYASTSVSQIAKEAGVSKGLVYNYFESKQDLLRQLIVDVIGKGEEVLDQANDSDSPEEELKHYVMDSIYQVQSNFEFWRMLSALAFQQEVLESIQDLVEEMRKSVMERGLAVMTKLGAPSPMESTLLLAASLDGLILYYMQMKDEFPIELLGQRLVETFTHEKSIHRSNKKSKK